jgi:hypothetical protein
MSVRLARARGESPVASACLLEMSGHRCLSRTAVQRPYSDVGEADAPADTAATTVTDPKLDRPMAPRFRVTYATLSADNDDLHTAYEQGLQTARSWFGSTLPVYVDGESRTTSETSEVRSPVTPPRSPQPSSTIACVTRGCRPVSCTWCPVATRSVGRWCRTRTSTG